MKKYFVSYSFQKKVKKRCLWIFPCDEIHGGEGFMTFDSDLGLTYSLIQTAMEKVSNDNDSATVVIRNIVKLEG